MVSVLHVLLITEIFQALSSGQSNKIYSCTYIHKSTYTHFYFYIYFYTYLSLYWKSWVHTNICNSDPMPQGMLCILLFILVTSISKSEKFYFHFLSPFTYLLNLPKCSQCPDPAGPPLTWLPGWFLWTHLIGLYLWESQTTIVRLLPYKEDLSFFLPWD